MSFLIVSGCFLAALTAFVHQAWLFQNATVTRAIDEWARQQRLVVLHQERRLLDTGPFFALTSADQPVFLLRVRADGEERRVWVQCGEMPWGVLAPTVSARWENVRAG
ncbi:MAG: hypothetical protein R3F59_19775 [Myxococcota bacterium]